MFMPLPLLAVLAAAAPPAAAPPRPGLWIGPIRACAGTVAEATVGEDEFRQPNLTIRFQEGWADVLHRVTAARVGRPMAIRLDGRVLAAPFVREPIAGGIVAVAPIAADEAETIRAAALGPC